MDEESEILYEVVSNDGMTRIVLTISSRESMTDEEYIAALKCFIDDIEQGRDTLWGEPTSTSLN